ncbi:MAG: NAD(P)-dependent oxidoreductase [Bacteroidota bacterium]|nr:NAD(P)-dependent oxidoreductase [Bacteroidota bacterium]MDP4258494.1 NAD(P)-dependent oxidoreductase [Bacteroidota bacterium]
MLPLLLILDDREGLIRSSSCWKELEQLVDREFLDGTIEGADPATLARAQFLMAIRERTALNETVFARMPNLKLVLQTGGHAYHIDTVAAKARGILIALGRRVRAPLDSVPELTFALALGLMHKVPLGNFAIRNGEWPLLTGRTLANRRLGILGLGRHGSRVAHIASAAFNMDVVAWDRGNSSANPTPPASFASPAIKRLPLDELLATSDVVSIHLRLSKESTGLINKERLALMRPDAILINTARGAIIDEAALAEALQNGKLAGAGLDVFVEEPLPASSSLRKLRNVILTPHIGWTVEEVFEEFARIACTQLAQFLEGRLDGSELLS